MSAAVSISFPEDLRGCIRKHMFSRLRVSDLSLKYIGMPLRRRAERMRRTTEEFADGQ